MDRVYKDDIYRRFSAAESHRHDEKLAAIKRGLVNTNGWSDKNNFSILSINEEDPHIGLANVATGLIGVRTEVLKTLGSLPIERHKWALQYIEQILFHERTHLQIQSEIRRAVLETHPDLDSFFHTHILRAWIRGQICFAFDESYITGADPLDLTEDKVSFGSISSVEKGRDFIYNYLLLLRKGQLTIEQGKIFHRVFPRIKGWQGFVKTLPDCPIENQFARDPQGVAIAFATLYTIIEAVQQLLRKDFEQAQEVDISVLEEGFCHFIGASRAGIGVMKDTSQSRYIANYLLQQGCPPYIALGQVHSHKTLYEFMKRAGVLDLEEPK